MLESILASFDPSPAGSSNFLFLGIPGNLGLLFSHAKQGSIPYSVSNPVAAGAQVAQVGNSGTTAGWPHLHYEAQEIDNDFESHPLGISGAEIGLNPTTSDPWRRTIPSWGIREGFFVLPEPSLGVSLAVGAAALAGLRRRRRP